MITNNPLDIFASVMIISISFLFPVEALKVLNGILRSFAKALAIVVLPQPGGPYSIIDRGCFFLMNCFNNFPSPIKCEGSPASSNI